METFKLYAIFNYAVLLPERFSLYDTEPMKGARRRKKRLAYFGLRTPGRVQRTIDQGINLLVVHVSRESDFDSFKSNNLRFSILACVVGLKNDITES